MMRKVHSVKNINFQINKSNPAQLVVHAIGMASSGGWTNGKLSPIQYVTQPADGVQDFDFNAIPPDGDSIYPQVLTEIKGSGEIQFENWMLGVRVHTESNKMTIMLS